MTQAQQPPDAPRDHRARIALAALTALLSGAARALTDWLINHLTN